MAKPGSKTSQVQDNLHEAVHNLELVDDGPVQHQQKLHKPTPAAGRGRGYGRSSLRNVRGGRAGPSGPVAPQPARDEGNVRVVPRPQPRSAQPALTDQAPQQTRGRQAGRGRGRGRSGPPTPFASHPFQGANFVQAGFKPREPGQDTSQPSSRPHRERFPERRGRSSALRGRASSRRPANNRSESEQNYQSSVATKAPGDSTEHKVPQQAPPQIQFGQFAAGFNPN